MHQIVTESLPTSRAAIAARIEQVRARTLALVEPLSEDALNRVHDPLMSPIVWDLGHIATFEDLWLAQNAFGVPRCATGSGASTTRSRPRAASAARFPTCGARSASTTWRRCASARSSCCGGRPDAATQARCSRTDSSTS